jgi:ABC-type lipoprotein release transport system permease subunit
VKLGDKLVLHAPGETGLAAFRVAGVFRTGSIGFDKATVFLELADAQHLLGLGDRVHELAVALDDPRRLPELAAFAQAELPRARTGESVEALTWKEREPRLAAILDLMTNTAWITYATLFAGMAFGIANALLMAVYERMREFGVLRSIGLPARDLVWLVLIESLLLTVGGALLGVALGAGAVAWMSRSGVNLAVFAEGLTQLGAGATIYPRLEQEDFMWPLVLAFATALIAAVWPAVHVARLRPAEALRRG